MAKKMKKTKKTGKGRQRTKKTAKAAPKKSLKASKASAKKPAAKSAKTSGGSGLQSIAAGLTANDAMASIAWYCNVLGFTVKQRWESDGQFRGAELASGNVTVNIGQDDWKLGRDRAKGLGTRLYVQMGPEIDAYAARIKAAGGVLDQEPADVWGVRAFAINDPDGFKLTFMTAKK